ncbi:hypothetical protein CspeluHIS016_0501900 [Cutaneotrichosporon spelunceum]|uniref:RING-type domain-containing protein n=1 Tax=Cutaneotrichosporon spelunceum TaxID=1672016 RepID=A0AAD3TWS4_9TREE|nr:hypothetical protein CspeluHIS016_0501900 [Cutaneotrichosporon spelunceum]
MDGGAADLLNLDMDDDDGLFADFLEDFNDRPANRDLDSESESDSSDIQVLDEAPEHLRPVIPPSPIMVSSGDEDGDEEPILHRPAKRPASGSVELLHSPPRTKQRVDGPDDQSIAGPSNASETIVTSVEYLVPVVLDVIPDVCPVWLRDNLQRVVEMVKDQVATPGQVAIDHVINIALEMERYPRSGDADKADVEEKEKGDYKDPKYRAAARSGYEYFKHSQSALEAMFTTIPVGYIRQSWALHGNLQLVPTYLYLHSLATVGEKPYKELKRCRQRKGKSRAEMPEEDPSSSASQANGSDAADEFHLEYAFLKELMADAAEKEQKEMAATAAKEKQEADHVERRELAVAEGRSRECGCCFDQESLEDLVACPEGHIFCRQCVASLAENKLGEQLTNITCMDVSQCDAAFTDAVLADVCGEKTMSLYHRLRQMKDLEMAAIDGLESCPHCPFAMVIENPDEKLFRCFNADCKQVTCRKCKRADHIPKRCEEVEEDFKLNKRHAIEEAMSAALMRRCPKCDKAYLKESGCNKITCQSCRTVSCYICQKAIPEDYAHFDQLPGRHGRNPGKCQLWDTGNESQADVDRIVNARDEAVNAAREAALQGGLELSDADLNVDAPAAVQAQGPVLYRGRPALADVFVGYRHAHQALNPGLAQAIARRQRRHELRLAAPLHHGIYGLGGGMLANHEYGMYVHQAPAIAHGDLLMNRMARLAGPLDYGDGPNPPQLLDPPPPNPWLPAADDGEVARAAYQRALAARMAAILPPRPAPPPPPLLLEARPAAIPPLLPQLGADEGLELRVARVQMAAQVAILRGMLAARRDNDENRDVGGLADEPLELANARNPPRLRGRAVHEHRARERLQRADELLALLGRRPGGPNSPAV